MSITIRIPDPLAIQTYDGLIDWIAQTLDRDDLQNQIPTFIRLAEYRIRRIIRSPERETTDFITTTAGNKRVSLPDTLTMLRSAYIPGDVPYHLELRSLSDVNQMQTHSGVPRFYALTNDTMILAPIPDDAYTIELEFIEDLDLLQDTNQTNWLLTNHADVYFYGALVQAEAFINDDPRIPLWKAAFDESLGEVNKQGLQRRFGGQPMRIQSPVVV